jgi:hypothetical protein
MRAAGGRGRGSAGGRALIEADRLARVRLAKVTPLYLAQDIADAQLLVDRLENAGISVFVRNRELQGMLGELPFSLRPEVCVLNERDLARAEVLKAEHDRIRTTPLVGEERRCAACGELSPPNFELCWSCREPFPAL